MYTVATAFIAFMDNDLLNQFMKHSGGQFFNGKTKAAVNRKVFYLLSSFKYATIIMSVYIDRLCYTAVRINETEP